MARMKSQQQIYKQWTEAPERVANEDLWLLEHALRAIAPDQFGALLTELAQRDPGDNPAGALAIRNALRGMPEELRALPLWKETLARVVKVCGDMPMRGHSSTQAVGRTLHDVARDRAALMVTCNRCKHRSVLYPHELAAKWGADFPLKHVAPRLKCTACDLKGGARLYEGTR